jgi:hypothetical protein
VKGNGKSSNKAEATEPQTYRGYTVGDIVFMPNVGVCRIVEVRPKARDNEWHLIVCDSRGIRWHTDIDLIAKNGRPTPAWVRRRQARLQRATARGKCLFKDCMVN